MKKIKYLFRVITGVRYKKLKKVIDDIYDRTNKNKFLLFVDIIWCGLRYGAGYNDYNIFAYYDMNGRQRKTYVTRVFNQKLIALLNNPEYTEIFNNKSMFNEKFQKFLKREFLILEKANLDEFKKFMKDKKTVFAKPNVGESGKGIEKLNVKDFESLEKMYDYLLSKKFGLIEEEIIQHKDYAKIYPLSVNSVRVVTTVINNKPRCAYATFKMGNMGKFVDNMENDGLCIPIDLENECLKGVAHTSRLVNFDKHPYTGVEFEGYKLPKINDAIKLCLEAALVVPEIGFVGWDVCMTTKGPAIIEGNNYPGYDFWQLPEHTPDKIGLKPYYQELLKEMNNKN